MNLLEFRAKELIGKEGISIPRGRIASTPEEARQIAEELGKRSVVKVQILEGGRGKAGGVKFGSTPSEVESLARSFLENELLGRKVHRVLVEEAIEAKMELYAGIINSRETGTPVAIIASAGGMEVEEIARNFPEKMARLSFSMGEGIKPFQIRQLARRAGVESRYLNNLVIYFEKLYRVFRNTDAQMIEINPMAIDSQDKMVALDAKLILDDDAFFRRNDKPFLEDLDLNPRERLAKEKGYGYVEFNLDGSIACAATGAGLGLTSMDLINDIAPEALAFFLDVGGRFVGSTGDVLKLAGMFPKLKAILINRYGGFGRGEIIAESIVKGLLEIKPKIPVMVHLSGSGEKGAIEYFKKMEPKLKDEGVLFEWTSHTVTGAESPNARKGGVDVIEYPVRRVLEWAGYDHKRKPPEWFPERKDWEEKTRAVIKDALSKRPEPEYQALAKVE
jgi:succinyl-CoA synthetase beta subunit